MKNYYDILDDHSSDEDLVINNNVNVEEAMGYPNQRPNPDPRYNKGSKKQSSKKLLKPIDNPANDEMKLFQKIFKIKYGWDVKIRSDEATEPNKDWLYIGVEEDKYKKNKLYLIDNKSKMPITHPVVEFNKVVAKIKNGGHGLTMHEVDVIAKVIKKTSIHYKNNYSVTYNKAFPIIGELIDEKLKDPESVKTKEHTRIMNALFKYLINVNLTSILSNQQINLTYYDNNIKPIIKELASIFLIHSEYFGSARHTAIAICEEILLRYNYSNEVSNQLYYALANLHSYAGAGWRREKYKLKLKSNSDLYGEIQKNNEASHNGLRRFIGKAEIQPNRKIDSHSLNVFDITVTEEESNHITGIAPSDSKQNLAVWDNIKDFSVITGVNGIGKTKILDSIHEEKKAKMEKAVKSNDQEISLKDHYHLYADSESNILRNVFGRKGYDFKYEYVYEKLIFYLDTDDYVERENVTKRAKKDINCKIALVLADKILCKMISPGENKKWNEILESLSKKTKSEQEKELKSIINEEHILKVAEHLVFIQNSIVEPMAFAKHLCYQHLQIVINKYSAEEMITKKENDPEFDEKASEHCMKQHGIIPPIKIINSLLTNYLPNFIAEYKYIPYARFKFTRNEAELPRESEIVISLNDGKSPSYKVNKDKKSGEIYKDSETKRISDELYNFLCNADPKTSLNEKQKKEIYDFIGLSHTPGHYEFIIRKIGDNEEDIHPQNLSSGELVAIKILLWSYVSRGLNFEDHQNQLTIDMLDLAKLYVNGINGGNPRINYETSSNKIIEAKYTLPLDFIGLPVDSYVESKNPGASAQNYLIETASLSSIQKNLLLKCLWPNKIKLLLLDEIDKHFDPKLSKALMDILRNEFMHENGKSQIIMTTHRVDTIALAPEGSIFTIEQDNSGIAQISKTHPLLAMFRLTGNLREFTNIHFKVYTEAPDDMRFYEGIYSSLKSYSDQQRFAVNDKFIAWTQEYTDKSSWKQQIISRRCQPSFHSTHSQDNGGGGGKAGVATMTLRGILSSKKKHEQQGDPLDKKVKTFSDSRLDSPFGIIDRDFTKHKEKTDFKLELKDKVLILQRHSIESYLLDPFIICSALNVEDIKKIGISDNLHHAYDRLTSLQKILLNLKAELDTRSNSINNFVQNYFIKLVEYISELVPRDKRPNIMKVAYLHLYLDKVIEILHNELKEKKSNIYLKDLFKIVRIELSNKKKFGFLEGKINNELEDACQEIKEESIKIINFLYSTNINIPNNEPIISTDQSDLLKDTVPIKIILGKDLLVEVAYPRIVLYMRGHTIENFIMFNLDMSDEKKFKEYLLEQIQEVDNLYIPYDLAETFFELNAKLRLQMNSIIKTKKNSEDANSASHDKDFLHSIEDNAIISNIQNLHIDDELSNRECKRSEDEKSILSSTVRDTSISSNNQNNQNGERDSNGSSPPLCIDASIHDPNYHKPFEKLGVNLQSIGTEVSHNIISSVYYIMDNIYVKNDNSDNHPAPLMIEDKSHIKPQSNEKISVNFNDLLYKATISFKSLDFMVDTFRFINEPSVENAQKTLRNVIHLQSIFVGNNMYSMTLSFIDITNQLSKGNVQEAGIQAITTISYVAIPTMLTYTGIPYLGFAYGGLMAGYTGYYVITNAYSLYSEYGTVEWQLKSAVAYKGLYEVFANSPLQHTYDFASNAKWYEIEANTIKLEIEKAQIKKHLEAKGEFGEKLYENIYAHILEAKYSNLEINHIALTIGEQYYEHCISIASVDSNDDHYNCYSEELEILDHVIIGEDGIVLNIEKL
ncbi:MAG: ATP-binding protein [Rickettsiales bacterium]|nr:ATP-binding protein [Rickettsiales bacterium]